jgi:hypothetical protein
MGTKSNWLRKLQYVIYFTTLFQCLHIGDEVMKAATKFSQQFYNLPPDLCTSKRQGTRANHYTEEL